MPIPAPLPLVVSGHAWVALEGATLSDSANVIKPSGDATAYTTVGVNAKPSASDTAWVKLGRISKIDMTRDDGQTIEIWAPAPGVMLLGDIIRTKQKRTFKISCQDVQALSIQLAFRTLTLNTSSSQFNAGEGASATKAWIKCQLYTHKNIEAVRFEFWADVDAKSLNFDPEKVIEPEYECTELFNVLNTGTMPNSLTA